MVGLPAGVTLGMVAAVLLPIALVTVLLRALPFSFRRLLNASPFIDYLGAYMPVGVMVVLVIYTVSGMGSTPGGMWAGLFAGALTLALHIWRRSAALSIFTGTVVYMLLVNILLV